MAYWIWQWDIGIGFDDIGEIEIGDGRVALEPKGHL